MPSIQSYFARAQTRLGARNPERLWLHYSFAISLFFGLLVATHWLSENIITRSVTASEGIAKSNEQIVLAQDILRLSSDVETGNMEAVPTLEKSIQKLRSIHEMLATGHSGADLVAMHYFEKDQPLYQQMNNFLNTAALVAGGSPQNVNGAVRRLYRQYNAVLRNDLIRAAELLNTQVRNEAAYFMAVKDTLFWATVAVLLAEALLIFWPAQRVVTATIDKMQRQTSVLRASQTRLEQANTKLDHIVHHDQLTGLPNRRTLTEYLGNAMKRGQASQWQLFFIGLDDFKSINDMIGHDCGDALLIAVSRGLRQCVDYDHMVAHVGGDSFVLFSNEEPDAVILRIMDAVDEPFKIKGRRIPINASIGYLSVGTKVRKPLDIVADAEIALQFAKNAGGKRAVEFTKGLRDDLSMMQRLQLELRDAIENGEIEPWFQPQVRLADGTLHGAEVLARWRHPTRGLLTPDVFLPAAESAGLMIDLDHAIWRSAMTYARIWEDTKAWRPMISLNAAPDTIGDPHLIERFLLALQRSGLSSDQVIVEVLETTLINGKDDMAAVNIDTLAECGIALELDDFGTGYASLSKLTQLPLAGIKLDRSLIAPLPDQAADSVVRAILALAAELGLHVVAEGVEEADQAVHLCERGCGVGQGYGLGRPMPPQDFTKWLADNAVMVPAMEQQSLQA